MAKNAKKNLGLKIGLFENFWSLGEFLEWFGVFSDRSGVVWSILERPGEG